MGGWAKRIDRDILGEIDGGGRKAGESGGSVVRLVWGQVRAWESSGGGKGIGY